MNILIVRFYQLIEEIRDNGIWSLFRKAIRFHDVVIPVYKDLSSVRNMEKPNVVKEVDVTEITNENVKELACKYTVGSRRLKAYRNTSLGYAAFAAFMNGEVVGDIWVAARNGGNARSAHPDLSWLNITPGENEAYMFDMYVKADSRGKAIANYLLGSALYNLKLKGISRVYGYYQNRNLPALWIHRLFGYTELSKITVRQILFGRVQNK